MICLHNSSSYLAPISFYRPLFQNLEAHFFSSKHPLGMGTGAGARREGWRQEGIILFHRCHTKVKKCHLPETLQLEARNVAPSSLLCPALGILSHLFHHVRPPCLPWALVGREYELPGV